MKGAMDKKLPILIIIPHGGYNIPEEITGYEAVDRHEVFMNSDVCANDLFDFSAFAHACVSTHISRLFIDLDRSYLEVPPVSNNGVIKKKTLNLKDVFSEDFFPDEMAISNMLRRYYFPFHESIEKIMKSGKIRLIIECHTIFPVGPELSPDPWMPRPIVHLENRIKEKESELLSCTMEMARGLMEAMEKSFSGEKENTTEKARINNPLFNGHILNRFGSGQVPMIRLSVSRSLFLNENYFNYEFLKIDEYRIKKLKALIWEGIERFYRKFF